MSYAEDQMERMGLLRCPGCPGTNPVIPSDGPIDSPYLFLGSKPGREENSRGRCFVGQTGKEFNNHLLPLSGLTRDAVRLTNVTRCYHDMDDSKPPAQAIMKECVNFHLKREIRQQKPQFIIPMGAVAGSLVSDLNVEMQHGIAVNNVNWWDHNTTTFPTYHPAAGLHATDVIQLLRMDFIELGRVIRGQSFPVVDEFDGCEDYRILGNRREVYEILDKYGRYDPIANDTETTPPNNSFWCRTFSLEPGTGYMVRRDNPEGLQAFRDYFAWHRGPVVYHNGMFDIPVEAEVDIHVPLNRFDDTMVRSYHLQYTPQALKYLAFRLCGMKMEEFEDVVLPYSTDVMISYILDLASIQWAKPEPQLVTDKNGEMKIYRPQGLTTKLKRMITDFEKNPTHKIFKRWDEWSDEEKIPAIEKFGFMPKASIEYVPLKKAIWYACRDADATLRVRAQLIRLKRYIRRMGLLNG